MGNLNTPRRKSRMHLDLRAHPTPGGSRDFRRGVGHNGTMRFVLIVLLASTAWAQNLVHNGDFELDTPAAPPAGWAMWGEAVYKKPQHFRRDTDVNHAGKASLRIEHPAGTGGYISTDPRHFIPAKAGMTYDLRFRAKADPPGRGVAGVGAYTQIDPLIDAPPPGSMGIELTGEWKEYHLKLVEGVDFDAASSPLLQLYFRAVNNNAHARVMWLDDVTLTATPNPPGLPKLIALGTVPYTPVDPVLKPGQALRVTIDANKPLRPATKLAAGISFHRVMGHPQTPYDRNARYTVPKPIEQAIADLRLPMTRFYGVGDERPGVNWAIDRAAELCTTARIPLDRVVLELEDQSARTKLSPEAWSAAVRHSVDRGYGFRHWEIGNEVYGVTWGHDTAFPHPDDYIAHLVAVSRAIKAVQPDARIGVSVRHDQLKWGSYVLARAAGHYDFVCPHLYGMDDARKHSVEQIVLDQNARLLDEAARLKAMIAAYNPGRIVTILDTEWGAHSIPPDRPADYEVRNGNIVGALHRAVRLIYYTREPLVEGASGWNLFGQKDQPGFATLPPDAPDRRTMLYWLHRHTIRHTGDQVLAMTGTGPFRDKTPITPLVATRTGDTVYVMIANGSWDTPVPAELTLTGVTPKSVTAIVLSQDNPDAPALLPDATDPATPLPTTIDGPTLTFTLPPHAVVYVTAGGAQ